MNRAIFPKRTTRMVGVLCAAVAAIAAGTSNVRAKDPPSEKLWPLAIEPAISSNFCEYRDGHLHAGIDIRTYGREGVACLAVGDGYVSRVRASPHGYGKTVYIHLDTGETAVYAHLSEFSPALEEAVYEEQVKSGRYSVDLRFSSDRFPVRRGEVIAYTGSTGTEAPHLHFEIRDAGENPLNPFSHGFTIEDTTPPSIDRLIFVPLDRDARINKRCYPIEVTSQKTGPNLFAVPDTLLLEGAVGVAAEIVDLLNPASGRLAPYQAGLSIDGTTVSEIRLERFSFDHTNDVNFLYDIGRVRLEEDYFIQLFERTGESLWNRLFLAGGRLGHAASAAQDASIPLHVAILTAGDRAGNSCALELVFRGDPGADVRWVESVQHEAPSSITPGFYFFEDLLSVRFESKGRSRIPIDRLAELGVIGRPADRSNGFTTYGADQFMDAPVTVPYYVDDVADYIHLCGLRKGRAKSINVPSLDLQLVVGERTVFTDLILYAAGWSGITAGIDSGELIPRSRIARIGPNSAVFQDDLEIRFLAGRADSTAAIYRLNERKMEWVFYISTVSGGVVSTTARRPGVYTVLSDKFGPRIREPFVRSHASYAKSEIRPEIVVPLEDAGSGVDDRRTAVYLAGVRQVARWDGSEKKMFILVRDQNIMGPQALSVAAYDKIGNRSQLDTTIDIRHTKQQGNQ